MKTAQRRVAFHRDLGRQAFSRFGPLWLLSAGLLLTAQGVSANEKVLLQLFDTLLQNGTITREQYDRLVAALKPAKAEGQAKRKPRGVEVGLDAHGLRFQSKDGRFKVKIGGRLHADASFHDQDRIAGKEASDGTEIRRGRIHIKGTLYKDWHFKAQYDFAGNKVGIKDLYLKYTGLKPLLGVPLTLAVGHLKQPYSLEIEMSSNDIPFIERALDFGITEHLVDRAIGLRLESHGSHWFLAGGLYGEGAKGSDVDDEGWGTAGRFIIAPIHNEGRLLHLGIRGAYRQPGDHHQIRFRYESTHKSSLYLVDTGKIGDLDGVTLAGGEAALVYGPLALEGEYTHAFIHRDHRPDLDFDGFHIQASWSLTGESRAASYKISAGKFKRLKPAHPFDPASGHFGALELAGRYGWIDLNDRDIRGGKAQLFTLGLNWYPNRNLRFMFDWSHVVDTSHALGVGWRDRADAEADGLNIFQMRGQLTF